MILLLAHEEIEILEGLITARRKALSADALKLKESDPNFRHEVLAINDEFMDLAMLLAKITPKEQVADGPAH